MHGHSTLQPYPRSIPHAAENLHMTPMHWLLEAGEKTKLQLPCQAGAHQSAAHPCIAAAANQLPHSPAHQLDCCASYAATTAKQTDHRADHWLPPSTTSRSLARAMHRATQHHAGIRDGQ